MSRGCESLCGTPGGAWGAGAVCRPWLCLAAALGAGVVLALCAAPGLARAAGPVQDVVAEWAAIHPPAAPALQDVRVSAADTALLVLDIEEATCNAERRPRCLDTVPVVADLLARARAAKMPVVYSLTRRGSPQTVLPLVMAQPGEPFVQSGVDKFFQTQLEALLKERGVKRVIVTGTAAHGAVLHTATGAALRDMTVVLPVDGLSAETPYIEQAAVWLLLEGPATRGKVALTRAARIAIE